MPVQPRKRQFDGRRNQNRKVGGRERRARHLLVSGGIATEKEYFRYVQDALSASGATLEFIPDGRNPARLLDEAVRLKDEDRRDCKRLNDMANAYQRVWVITDTDDFAAEIMGLLPKAQKAGVEFVISNPCFEVFVVLHDESYTKYCDATQIQAVAKKKGMVTGTNNKNLVFDKIYGNFDRAEVFSQQLRRQHQRDDKFFPENNPSTSVDEVVRALIDSACKSIPGFEHIL
ncbi:RloB family protein [Pseudarthrobacter sp. efr-133-R2A-89]|uniref:RloB family protein n=1 Tax=Pseudarthrobacter sp. efr-133-R2A-89 TaxID=3040302 RepID=UPI0025533D56|nr:RloB family protein [Pseudarthrobacter sp. efr-133-R2A-89]